MADASVTIKVSPKEFDLLRRAIEDAIRLERAEREELGPTKARQESVQYAANLSLMLQRMT